MNEDCRLVMRGADGRLRELTEEELKTAVLFDKGGPTPDKKLSPEEVKALRVWARENFKINTRPDPAWHPAVQDEWEKMQYEADKLKK